LYKVIYVDTTQFGAIEDDLNAAAEEGYKFASVVQITGRALIIMEKKAQAGRPKKGEKEEESGLGE
jgi:hypothetical protein